jgi:hypothetical protein
MNLVPSKFPLILADDQQLGNQYFVYLNGKSAPDYQKYRFVRPLVYHGCFAILYHKSEWWILNEDDGRFDGFKVAENDLNSILFLAKWVKRNTRWPKDRQSFPVFKGMIKRAVKDGHIVKLTPPCQYNPNWIVSFSNIDNTFQSIFALWWLPDLLKCFEGIPNKAKEIITK